MSYAADRIMPTAALSCQTQPDKAYDQYVEKRIEMIGEILQHKLQGLNYKVIDTAQDMMTM